MCCWSQLWLRLKLLMPRTMRLSLLNLSTLLMTSLLFVMASPYTLFMLRLMPCGLTTPQELLLGLRSPNCDAKVLMMNCFTFFSMHGKTCGSAMWMCPLKGGTPSLHLPVKSSNIIPSRGLRLIGMLFSKALPLNMPALLVASMESHWLTWRRYPQLLLIILWPCFMMQSVREPGLLRLLLDVFPAWPKPLNPKTLWIFAQSRCLVYYIDVGVRTMQDKPSVCSMTFCL